jgi:D-lactate dehydrogenase (cytochrome)
MQTRSSSASTLSAPLPKQPTMEDFNKALEKIKAILPKECVSIDRDELITHGSSGWTYHDPKVLPGAVLFPRHTDDVSEL